MVSANPDGKPFYTAASIIKGFEALVIKRGSLGASAKGLRALWRLHFGKRAIPFLAFSCQAQKPKLASYDEQCFAAVAKR